MGSFVSLDLILFFLFFELTLVPVVLPHRRLGLRPAGLRGDQVLRLHVRRVGLPAGGHRGRRLHPPVPDRGAHLRAAGPDAHPPVGHRGRAAVPAPSPRPSPSRRRSSRSTPGRPTPTPRPRRPGPSCWWRSWPSWAPTGSSASTSTCSPRPAAPGAGAAHPGGHRHPLRRHRGLRPAGPEAPAGLLVAGPDRLHRPRHLRPDQPGPERRRAPDGQPRPGHRHPVHPGGLDLRAPQDLADRLAAGPAVARPGAGRRVHRGHAGLDRRARAQRVRGRVPDPHRHLRGPPVVGGGGHGRRGPRRRLPAVGLPAGLPRRADRGGHHDPGPRRSTSASSWRR